MLVSRIPLTTVSSGSQFMTLESHTQGLRSSSLSVTTDGPVPPISGKTSSGRPRGLQDYISVRIEFAVSRPDLTFMVTEIGCGLAGYKPKAIAPLFREAVKYENIYLPARFWHKLNDKGTENS